jgi:hypothetical protein
MAVQPQHCKSMLAAMRLDTMLANEMEIGKHHDRRSSFGLRIQVEVLAICLTRGIHSVRASTAYAGFSECGGYISSCYIYMVARGSRALPT